MFYYSVLDHQSYDMYPYHVLVLWSSVLAGHCHLKPCVKLPNYLSII